jgi:hypothetical protein
MYLIRKGFLVSATVAAVSGAFLLAAIAAADAKPGKADPKGNPNCDGNTPITSPARPCNGNNGFGNGGGDGTPSGKQDDSR